MTQLLLFLNTVNQEILVNIKYSKFIKGFFNLIIIFFLLLYIFIKMPYNLK